MVRALARRLMRVIVPILKFLEAGQIVCQHGSIALHQAFVVRGLPDGIDRIVEDAVIPSPLIEIGLHLVQLFFRSFQTPALLVACPDGAPDVFQIGPHMHENVRPPPLASKSLFAIAIPVLRSRTERQCRDDYACRKAPLHDRTPSGLLSRRRIVIVRSAPRDRTLAGSRRLYGRYLFDPDSRGVISGTAVYRPTTNFTRLTSDTFAGRYIAALIPARE